jgi:putative Holliday junction resolvase
MITKDITEFCSNIPHMRAMGIDYGLKKTGIAVSDKDLTMSLPVCVINTSSQEVLLQKITNLISQYEIGFFVLGIPDESRYSSEIYRKFANLLEQKFRMPIFLEDETYTSRIADEMLKDIGLNRKKRNRIDDQISAKLILDSFLDKVKLRLSNI